MGINFITDDSLDGLKLRDMFVSVNLENLFNHDYSIRWGNWWDNSSDCLTLNVPYAIRNALDKENVILMLSASKVQCPRIIKPGKKTIFPIIGRKYEHKNGSDIKIIDSLDECCRMDCDYFLQYIKFEKEYKVHVMDLEVIYIEEKYKEKSKETDEFCIRSSSFGWNFREVKLEIARECESEQLFKLACRAVYCLGLDFGTVSIGKTYDDKYYVLDVDPTCKGLSEKCKVLYVNNFIQTIQKHEAHSQNYEDITLGADPECLIKDKKTGEIVLASDFFNKEGEYGFDDRSIESGKMYFPIVELRPEFSINPMNIIASIEDIFKKMNNCISYSNIGLYAGNMPVYNYWTGGHIHFGTKPNTKLLRALDSYLALTVMMIEQTYTSRQRKLRYGYLGNYRIKSHGGFEYRTLGSWLVNKNIATSVITLAKVIVQEYLNLTIDYIINYQDIVAFYSVNKFYFKPHIKNIISRLQQTNTYKTYSPILETFFQNIIGCVEWDEKKDIKEEWGIVSTNNSYKIESTCYMPEKRRKELGVNVGDIIDLMINESVFNLKVVPKDDFMTEKKGFVNFSEDICNFIGIRQNQTLGLWFDKNNKVFRAGPIFGIFADKTNHSYGPFGMQTFYFRKLIKLAKNKGMIGYVFTMWDIDWQKKRIKGYDYDFEKDEWIRCIYPLPDVIYDRGDLIVESTYGQYATDYLNNIKKYNIKLINSIECIGLTNNKWSTYEFLFKNNNLLDFIPETLEYINVKQINRYLEKYQRLFIKLKDGSKSKGIFSIEKNDNCEFLIVHRNTYGYNETFKVSKADLMKEIDNKITVSGRKKTDYIVQEGISLAQYEGRSFEIRVVMQKNSKNLWLRTCMIARISGENDRFINSWNEVNKKASEVLRESFKELSIPLANRIREISNLIVKAFDEKGIHAGEIAIDYGIDKSLNIKIIELNSKPDNFLSSIGAFKMRNLAINRILEYGRYLAFRKWNV